MSYTNPHGQPQGAATRVTNLLRQIIIAEIVAINSYQNHISNSDISEINQVWHHIMVNEKSHYIIAMNLLRKYDPVQYKYLSNSQEAMPGSAIPTTDFSGTESVSNSGAGSNTNTNSSASSGSRSRKSSGSSSRPQTEIQAAKPVYDKYKILNYLREDIKGELEAVILYEDELASIQHKDVRSALQKIIDDEKHHAEHLTQVLLKHDPDPYEG
ncbi:MAG: ferritin-like protein [Eubacterium sp.]|jgi:rubrerythrin|nr:ferritin-like protein [Eubacterium sp.]